MRRLRARARKKKAGAPQTTANMVSPASSLALATAEPSAPATGVEATADGGMDGMDVRVHAAQEQAESRSSSAAFADPAPPDPATDSGDDDIDADVNGSAAAEDDNPPPEPKRRRTRSADTPPRVADAPRRSSRRRPPRWARCRAVPPGGCR